MNLIWIILLLCCCNKNEGCGGNPRPEPRCCEPVEPRCCEPVEPRMRCGEPKEPRCYEMPLQPFAPIEEDCGCTLHEACHEPHQAYIQKERCDCRE